MAIESEKRRKFKALAESRTTKALEAIGRIGNLSNRQAYEFDDVDIRKIAKALRDAVALVEARFDSTDVRKSRFKL